MIFEDGLERTSTYYQVAFIRRFLDPISDYHFVRHKIILLYRDKNLIKCLLNANHFVGATYLCSRYFQIRSKTEGYKNRCDRCRKKCNRYGAT